jgi:peptidoglycan hydrolase-like protein with peptidoglycan-binding domain
MTEALLGYGDKGPRVMELQSLLNDNDYFRPMRRLVIDGEFGCLTASAVQQVKYWLGYAKDDIEPVAGEPLFDYLGETRPLPGAYRARRKARQEKARTEARKKPLRLKALSLAEQDVGLVEGTGNRIKYNDWWCAPRPNDRGAYCVRAGSYWYAKAGSTAVVRGSRWENTDALLEDAKRGRNGVHLTSDPHAGDGFVIDWDGHADPDHYGVFIAPASDGQVRTVEANATLASGAQGVGYHKRPAAQCWFIVFER